MRQSRLPFALSLATLIVLALLVGAPVLPPADLPPAAHREPDAREPPAAPAPLEDAPPAALESPSPLEEDGREALAHDIALAVEASEAEAEAEVALDGTPPAAPRGPLALTTVATGLGRAVALVEHPTLPGARFLLRQDGAIDLLLGTELAALPALDLRERVRAGGEAGLHSLAFHPREPQRAFVFYNTLDGALLLDELLLPAHARAFDAATRIERLVVPPAYGAHNGGALAFGPDGYLYASVGDGGAQDDPDGRAQDLASWHGKILRIDVDVEGAPYGVPSDNPFPQSARPEVWALGFRNPWRMGFDAGTGDLWIADVGGSIAEEIDLYPASMPGGANFGWRVLEGTTRRWNDPIGETVAPVHEYRPASGRCAVTGGMLYRGSIDELHGQYLYSDFCDGRLRALSQDAEGAWHDRVLFETGGSVVHLSLDHDESILVLQYNGTLYRLGYGGG